MKKLFLVCLAALSVATTVTTFAQGNDTPPPSQSAAVAPAGVTLSDSQLATIDSLVKEAAAKMPASEQSTVDSVLKIVGTLMIIGRVFYGIFKGGLFQGLHGLFTGSNTPNPPGNIPKGAQELSKLGLFAVVGLSACLITGCASHQVVNFSKGTGVNLNLPIGYNGANLAEINLKVGQFYTATAVQPVGTNQVYVPAVAFASRTTGSILAPQVGATNTAAVTGGDDFTAAIGAGSAGTSNVVGSASSSGK